MSRLVSFPAQTIGPFFHFALANNAALGCLAGPGAKGERIRIRFRVLDGNGAAVPDALIEIWQADAFGKYDHPEDPREEQPDPMFCGFGRLATDDDGAAVFETIRPGRVPGASGGSQASHLNISIFARGLNDRLATRVYFAGDPALGEDPILALVPEDRRETLLARADSGERGLWHFEIRLQGPAETVFFDL